MEEGKQQMKQMKLVSLRLDSVLYDDLQSYLTTIGSTVTGFCRVAVRTAFITALESDRQFLDLIKRNLEEAENYGLSRRQVADLERQNEVLSARVKAFEEIYFDLIAEREASYAEA